MTSIIDPSDNSQSSPNNQRYRTDEILKTQPDTGKQPAGGIILNIAGKLDKPVVLRLEETEFLLYPIARLGDRELDRLAGLVGTLKPTKTFRLSSKCNYSKCNPYTVNFLH